MHTEVPNTLAKSGIQRSVDWENLIQIASTALALGIRTPVWGLALPTGAPAHLGEDAGRNDAPTPRHVAAGQTTEEKKARGCAHRLLALAAGESGRYNARAVVGEMAPARTGLHIRYITPRRRRPYRYAPYPLLPDT